MASIGRFLTIPQGNFFLFGPRGTGKTTWLELVVPDALMVNLLEPETYRTLAARPERLRELVLAAKSHDVVVDEVQRIPDLLHVVHDLIGKRTPHRFILTGSSARKLRRGGVNLLGGRAVVRTLHPFLAAELPRFDLAQSLRIGLVPLVVTSPAPEDVLAAYATLYLEQEVQVEGLVRNIGSFARFLEVVSFSHGSVLNLSNVARESAVTRKSVEGYLEILEDLLLAYRIPVFTRRAKRDTSAHPKFYLFDAGVFRSLRPAGPLDRPEEIEGAALEGMVAQHLRAWLAYGDGKDSLFFWRTRSGVEVDLVLYGRSGLYGIEVKNTSSVRPEDLRALRAFGEDYPDARLALLYRGKERLRMGKILCMPVGEFLTGLRPGTRPPCF